MRQYNDLEVIDLFLKGEQIHDDKLVSSLSYKLNVFHNRFEVKLTDEEKQFAIEKMRETGMPLLASLVFASNETKLS